jgi:hypothetical protein
VEKSFYWVLSFGVVSAILSSSWAGIPVQTEDEIDILYHLVLWKSTAFQGFFVLWGIFRKNAYPCWVGVSIFLQSTKRQN